MCGLYLMERCYRWTCVVQSHPHCPNPHVEVLSLQHRRMGLSRKVYCEGRHADAWRRQSPTSQGNERLPLSEPPEGRRQAGSRLFLSAQREEHCGHPDSRTGRQSLPTASGCPLGGRHCAPAAAPPEERNRTDAEQVVPREAGWRIFPAAHASQIHA